MSYEEKWSSAKLINVIIERYFLVKDDSKIGNCSSRSDLFITKDSLLQKGYSEI